MNQNYPDAKKFVEDLKACAPAARIETPFLSGEVGKLKGKMNQVKKERERREKREEKREERREERRREEEVALVLGHVHVCMNLYVTFGLLGWVCFQVLSEIKRYENSDTSKDRFFVCCTV